jgi:hypothetical protein
MTNFEGASDKYFNYLGPTEKHSIILFESMRVKREFNCTKFLANWPILVHNVLLNSNYALEMRNR